MRCMSLRLAVLLVCALCVLPLVCGKTARTPFNDATVTSINVFDATGLPVPQFAFQANQMQYQVAVPAENPSVTFFASSTSPNATLYLVVRNTVMTTLIPGVASPPVALVPNDNVVAIYCISFDQTNQVVYQIDVVQLLSSVTALSVLNLALPDGTPLTLTPPFAPGVTQYNVNVPATANAIAITMCSLSATANMFVQMNRNNMFPMNDANNQTTIALPTNNNMNWISVYVQAPNGNVQQTTLAVARTGGAMNAPNCALDGSCGQASSPAEDNSQNVFAKNPVLIAAVVAASLVAGFLIGSAIFAALARRDGHKGIMANVAIQDSVGNAQL